MKRCMPKRPVYSAWEYTSETDIQPSGIPGVYMHDGRAKCMTSRGVVILNPQDVVIMNPGGELDVVTPQVFEQAFEEVTDPTL